MCLFSIKLTCIPYKYQKQMLYYYYSPIHLCLRNAHLTRDFDTHVIVPRLGCAANRGFLKIRSKHTKRKCQQPIRIVKINTPWFFWRLFSLVFLSGISTNSQTCPDHFFLSLFPLTYSPPFLLWSRLSGFPSFLLLLPFLLLLLPFLLFLLCRCERREKLRTGEWDQPAEMLLLLKNNYTY